LIIFNFLLGNWKVKKYINKNTFAKGQLILKKNKNFYYFKETLKTNLNNKFINSFQTYKIIENKKTIIFYFNFGISKNKMYQKFNKDNLKPSLFFCGKDLYMSSLNILSKNYFIIYTKIRGPKKNYNILTKYFRTI